MLEFHNDTTDAELPENQGLQAFTFWVGETLFAVPMNIVLAVRIDEGDFRPFPGDADGLLGLVTYQDHPVPVFDFADHVGVRSAEEIVSSLSKVLDEREQDHVDWLDALEVALKTGGQFNKALDPTQCAFGRWLAGFKTRDDVFLEILEAFVEPHKALHATAESLLVLRDRGEKDEALKRLELARHGTLKNLRRLFKRAREQLHDSMRPVLLMITSDSGETPALALRIDEIADVVTFENGSIVTHRRIGVPIRNVAEGLLVGVAPSASGCDCLVVDPVKMLSVVQQAA